MKPNRGPPELQSRDEDVKHQDQSVRNPSEGFSEQRRSASEREKARMRDMNSAFDRLRIKLGHKKTAGRQMSKIQALRFAIQYIQELQGNLYQPSSDAATSRKLCFRAASDTKCLATSQDGGVVGHQRSTSTGERNEEEEQQLLEHLVWQYSMSTRDRY